MTTVVKSQEDEIQPGDGLKHFRSGIIIVEQNVSRSLTEPVKHSELDRNASDPNVSRSSTKVIESDDLSSEFSFNITKPQNLKSRRRKNRSRKNSLSTALDPLAKPRRRSKRRNKRTGSKSSMGKTAGFALSSLSKTINGQKWISELPQKLEENDGTLFEIVNGKIKAIYKDDLNILQIHSYICEKLSLESKNISQLEEELKNTQLEIKKPHKAIVMNSLLTKLVELMGKIQELKTGSKYHMYLMSVNPLIENYRKIGSKFRKVSFSTTENSDSLETGTSKSGSSSKQQTNHKNMTDSIRHTIVEQYIDIAKRFVDIDSYRIIDQEEKCFECGTDLSEFKFDTNGVSYCPECGEEVVQIVHLPFYYDQSRVSSDKNTYKDRDNFINILKKFKGEIPVVIPEDMELQLDIYFVKNGCPTGKDVRAMPLNSDGESRGKLTRADLHEALKKTKNVKFYDDVSVIASNYWGWNLPVIKDSVVAQIIKDYDESQEVFQQFKGDRKSSMNTHYRLFRHLWKRGIKRNPDDFKMIKTEKTLKYHEKAWKNFCDRLDWEWIPFEQIKYYFSRI